MNIYESLLVLIIFVVVFIGILKIIAKTSKWEILSSSFPPSNSSPVLREYRNESGFAGNMELDSNLTVRVKEEGFELHVMNPFMPDIFICWERIDKIEVDTTYGRTFLNFIISHPADINFRLPEEVSTYIDGKVAGDKFEKGMEVNSIGDIISFVKESSRKKQRRLQ